MLFRTFRAIRQLALMVVALPPLLHRSGARILQVFIECGPACHPGRVLFVETAGTPPTSVLGGAN